MKKLIIKDQKLRKNFKSSEKLHFVLKLITNNLHLFSLLRFNASSKLKNFSKTNSKVSLSNRCIYTFNKTRFNKLTRFSRQIFLKLIRSGKISGLRKITW